ncbi:MAG: hypothetical protein O9306_12385, partial [Beijerinckiaceae bacterium]|nr:hypothetical protein [Beijerinckiaceae bacterium]
TKVAQPLQPFVDIEKSRLASHRPSSPTVIGAIESETGRSGEVFRTVHLANNRTNKSRTISMNIAQHINPIKMNIKNILGPSENSRLSQSHVNKI